MTEKEIATCMKELLELPNLTPDQVKAINICQMEHDRNCGNCRYHSFIKILKGKYSEMPLKRCSNKHSEMKRAYTKDFITCSSWERLTFPDETEEIERTKENFLPFGA